MEIHMLKITSHSRGGWGQYISHMQFWTDHNDSRWSAPLYKGVHENEYLVSKSYLYRGDNPVPQYQQDIPVELGQKMQRGKYSTI